MATTSTIAPEAVMVDPLINPGEGIIAKLSKIPLEEGCPTLEPLPASIDFHIQPVDTHPIHYLDHGSFPCTHTEWIEWLGRIEDLLQHGKQFIHMLYTFRCVSRAIPMATTASTESTTVLYKETFAILRPEIQKIKDLLDFVAGVQASFTTILKRMIAVDWRKQIVPEALLLGLIRTIDLLQKFDGLKDIKASLNNDFSRFKRAWTAIRTELADGEEVGEMVHEINLFLASPTFTKNLIIQTLRAETKKIDGNFEEILLHLLSLAQDYLTKEYFLLPEDKYVYIRVLPYLLWLIDGDHQIKKAAGDPSSSGPGKGADPVNVFRHRSVKISALQEIFRRYPVVPEFADMTLSLGHILEKIPHYDAATMDKAWGRHPDEKVAHAYDLRSSWRGVKTEYDLFLAHFVFIRNGVTAQSFKKGKDRIADGRTVYVTVLQGLRYLQRWSSLILELLAWKSTHPCPADAVEKMGGKRDTPGFEYECIGKYNYSKEELSVFVDMISMCKSLADVMSRAEGDLGPLIRLYVHDRIQKIIQGDLVPVLHRVHKYRSPLLELLLELRTFTADWGKDNEPVDDYKKYRRAHGPVKANPRSRVVTPSITQLQIMRASLETLMQQAVVGGGSCFGAKKDMLTQEMSVLVQAYEETYYIPYLLDYRATIPHIIDFSTMWFREFYLELTRQIQFPIDMSLPWILTEHVIQNQSTEVPLLEKAMYMLDVYNDAAQRALYSLNKQFLYDEIEAEVNLVFDQFTFLVSDDMYAYFKNYAASMVMDKVYKNRYDSLRGGGVNGATAGAIGQSSLQEPSRRFHIPLQQRHLRLLGRSIDLNDLIGHNVGDKLISDLELTLKRFESQDATAVLDLETALNVLKVTHDMLSKHVNIRSFDAMLQDVMDGGGIAGAAFKSRLARHLLTAIVDDLLPNFSYNMYTSRFIRSPMIARKVSSFGPAPKVNASAAIYGNLTYKAYDNQSLQTRTYFGVEHMTASIRLLDSALPKLIQELMSYMEDKALFIKIYASALIPGIPPCKLPKFMFKSGGVYAAFETLLKPVSDYEDLKPEVFQTFREMGNALAFVKDLSDLIDLTDIFNLIQAAPYLGIHHTPKGYYEQAATADSPLLRNIKAFVEAIQRHPSRIKVKEAVEGLIPESQRWHTSFSKLVTSKPLLQLVLHRLDTFITTQGMKAEWLGKEPDNGVIEVESTREFYRFWSALSFLFSCEVPPTSPRRSMPPDDEEFGHGFTMMGITLVHLLGQRERFNLLDFSFHLLNVQEYENSCHSGTDDKVGKVDQGFQTLTKGFIQRAGRTKALTRNVFSLLEKVYPLEPSDLLIFRPPKTVTVETTPR